MKKIILFITIIWTSTTNAQYPPAVGQTGTTAIHKDSSLIVNWGYAVTSFTRGDQNISIPNGLVADFGDSTEALGYAEGTSTDVVSLGDGGSITIALEYPIQNGLGPDFAVFENSFTDDFLELAFVEVSTDGIHFVRFPAISLTDTSSQIGPFGNLQTTHIHNLAGKYRQGYGTPFDLNDLVDSSHINLDSINYIRVIDVVGSIDHQFASYDSNGNIINDPFPTAFSSCGFDLDAIGVIHENNIYAGLTEQENTVAIYPNPSSDYIFIQDTGTAAEMKLYNMNGQCVKHCFNCKKIPVFDLKNGTYILSVTTSKLTLNQRVMIHH